MSCLLCVLSWHTQGAKVVSMALGFDGFLNFILDKVKSAYP